MSDDNKQNFKFLKAENKIKNSHGGQKIALDGYFYNYENCEIGKLKFRCNKRKCGSRLTTNLNDKILLITKHSHGPDYKKFNHVLLSEKAKGLCLETNIGPRQIVLNALEKTENKPISFDLEVIQRTVRRHRIDNNYTKQEDYDIPVELQNTKHGDKFLLFDSGINDPDRIIIFSTNSNLTHIKYSDVLVVDGTFKSAPSDYEQLFTIQCRVRNDYVPLLYCFMKKKDTVSYKKLFTFLRDQKSIDLKEKYVILDFEMASFKSIFDIYENVKLRGCNFHFGQILWRKLTNLKMKQCYIAKDSFRLNIKMILALSFVPDQDVVLMSDKLERYFKEKGLTEECIIFKWFKINYIEHSSPNRKIKFWNVYQRTLEGIPRTTNSIEGMHRHFNNLIQTKQSSIIKILEELQGEQVITENKLTESLYLKKQTSVTEDLILEVVKSYDTYYDMQYLKAIALNFNWKMD